MSLLVCPKCGKRISEYMGICSNCGCKIADADGKTVQAEQCIINGVKCDKEEVKAVIHNGEYLKFLTNECGMTGREASHFLAVIKFNNNEIPDSYEECLERYIESNRARGRAIQRYKAAKAIHCPRCHSTNVEKFLRGGLCPYVRWRCEKCGRQFSV